MNEIRYTTIDKSSWPRGPWDDEPDKIQWTDEGTGLPCIARRAGKIGHWCGYVGVDVTHPLFGKEYNNLDLDIHGGITFAEACSHGDQATSICHIPEPGKSDEIWWFGFDCGHSRDYSPGMETYLQGTLSIYPRRNYRTLEYVRNECKSLARQLKGLYSAE